VVALPGGKAMGGVGGGRFWRRGGRKAVASGAGGDSGHWGWTQAVGGKRTWRAPARVRCPFVINMKQPDERLTRMNTHNRISKG
jgi:hypothetical protein